MALKDKLMTLEDFKAVRDVDVASNSAQFTEIKADLNTLANVTPIPDNSDLNSYAETGLYSIENSSYTILHYPTDTVVASYLEVTALTTGYIAQKMTFAGLGTVYVRRRYSNGNWNEWIQIAEISNDLMTPGKAADSKKVGDELSEIRTDLATLADITPIPDNSDLNNYGETGLYSIEYSTYTILNYPPVAIAASYLEVRRLTTGYIGQKLTLPGLGKVFTRRRYNNGQWNNWIQITGLEPGLSTDEKRAIITCFENVAWSSQNANTVLNELKVLWGMDEDKDIEFKYPNDVGMIAGRMQKTSNDDNTAFLNTASNVHAATLGLAGISDNSAPVKFNNAIYGIKQGSHNKINCEATYTGASNDLKWAFSVCTIIDGVYHIKTNGSKVDFGVSQSLPSNPNNDNYVFVKLEGNTLFPHQVTTSCTIKLIEE